MARTDAPTAAAFFESYRAAFAYGDMAAILDHFAFPCHITSEAREVTLTPIAGREEGVHMVEHLLALYREVGVSTARVLELATLEVSPRLYVALVHWALDDARGPGYTPSRPRTLWPASTMCCESPPSHTMRSCGTGSAWHRSVSR
jgi:hypothetical protein